MTDNQKKYWDELKAKHPEALLLLRCGDFYEAYCEDAKECAKILGITLTWRTPTMRHKPGDYSDAMAGFPHYALDSYLPKLIRAHKRVAICDPLPAPKETNKRKSETKNSETMKQKAADLIGKTIFVANTTNKFVIKSYDGDKLMTEFSMDGKQPIPCPLMMSQLRTMVEQGKYIIGEGDAAPASTDEVEEVTDVQPRKPASAPKAEKPKAEKPKAEKPKAEKPKTEKPKAGKYTFKTYTRPTSEGGTKTLGRIDGFVEGDELLDRAMADKLHASPMSDRQKDGSKVWWLSFGRRYVEAGRKVCDALNAGKSITELQAIVDAQTSENHAAAEVKRQEREARKNTAAAPKGKTYTEAEVADLIARVIKGDEEAMRIVNDLKAA